MKKPVGVLRFPGTNCDRDVFEAVQARGQNPKWLWHGDRFEANEFSALILPGGFSYGDYLRAGALAARSPAMASVKEAASAGIPILGICNGFQILCEAGLLPGVLVPNAGRRFIDDWVSLRLRNPQSHFAKSLSHSGAGVGPVTKLPIAHADGRFLVSNDELRRLQDSAQIWWTYEKNPNGSCGDIAGVINETGNVAALMPHPERAMVSWMGGTDGSVFFDL
jgi:phosphoribosylformylglycinamidine synthase I